MNVLNGNNKPPNQAGFYGAGRLSSQKDNKGIKKKFLSCYAIKVEKYFLHRQVLPIPFLSHNSWCI